MKNAVSELCQRNNCIIMEFNKVGRNAYVTLCASGVTSGQSSQNNVCVFATLREECRLRVFENRILRRIFGSKRDENGETAP